MHHKGLKIIIQMGTQYILSTKTAFLCNFRRPGLDAIPLYIDWDQYSLLHSPHISKHEASNESIGIAIKKMDCQNKTGYFTEMDPAIEYVDKAGESTIHVNTWFAMMNFANQSIDPCAEILKSKAIRFEYNTLDLFDYADDYFKRVKVRIPMCLMTKNLYDGSSRFAIMNTYCLLLESFHKSKFIKLEVLGRLFKQYGFYKIDPIYVSIDCNGTLPL